jgi:hypothetical protein
MVQVVGRRPLTAEAPVRFQVSACEVFATGIGFPPNTSTFPRQYHSANAPYLSSSTCCSYHSDKWVKPGNLPKSNLLSEIGGGGEIG